jgi:hypothetical protein
MPRGVYLRTEENTRNLGQGMKGKTHSDETRRRMSLSQRGTWTPERREQYSDSLLGHQIDRVTPAVGFYISDDGYRILTTSRHVLSIDGCVGEHRVVLYEKIGSGPHSCHWCGVTLRWGGRGGINADHVDFDKLNNDPENLVPSCLVCNIQRMEEEK